MPTNLKATGVGTGDPARLDRQRRHRPGRLPDLPVEHPRRRPSPRSTAASWSPARASPTRPSTPARRGTTTSPRWTRPATSRPRATPAAPAARPPRPPSSASTPAAAHTPTTAASSGRPTPASPAAPSHGRLRRPRHHRRPALLQPPVGRDVVQARGARRRVHAAALFRRPGLHDRRQADLQRDRQRLDDPEQFDIAAQGGGKTALVKSFTVNLTGGTGLNLSFIKGALDNPIISAIELIGSAPADTTPPAVPSGLAQPARAAAST